MKSREILERPFPAELVRHRPGRNGEDVTYLEAHVIIGRLNEAFAGDWSFTIDEHEMLEDEVIVLGRLTAGDITKSAFGSSSITRTRDGGRPVSIGDDLKAASTDALKKSSTLLGVGLTLRVDTADAASAKAQPKSTPSPNGNGFLSSAQLRAIHAIRRRLGWSDAKLAEHAARLTGAADIERMDKRSASQLIEAMQAEATPVEAAR
jgi:hypothetical protein